MELNKLMIKEIQSLFNRLGLGKLEVDGIIGPRTTQAIIDFQRRNNLAIDGIIGSRTYQVINNYLNGYYNYVIKEGDTFYKIAQRNGIDYRLIVNANSNLDPNNLIVGTSIVVPYGIEIVPTDMEYTYQIMLRNLRSLKTLYPFITLGQSGESSLGRGLYYVNIGTGDKKVFYNGSHHALEWITTPLLMKYMERYLLSYVLDRPIGDVSSRELYEFATMTIMPMVNPDGVTLVLEGLDRSNPNYENLIRWNNGSTDFSNDWQANNKGVDINHNYNAAWEEYKILADETGYDTPGPTRYPGMYAESEPETRGVVSLVDRNNFDLAIAYHTQGEVIYWQFQNLATERAREIGQTLAELSGYVLANEEGLSSYSGFKDWYILKYRKPGYTIEVGKGKNPIPINQFNEIYNENVKVMTQAALLS